MNERETTKEKQSLSRTRKELINLARPFQASGALFFGALALGLDHGPIRMQGVRATAVGATGMPGWRRVLIG